jgi:hypothetical protein
LEPQTPPTVVMASTAVLAAIAPTAAVDINDTATV